MSDVLDLLDVSRAIVPYMSPVVSHSSSGALSPQSMSSVDSNLSQRLQDTISLGTEVQAIGESLLAEIATHGIDNEPSDFEMGG